MPDPQRVPCRSVVAPRTPACPWCGARESKVVRNWLRCRPQDAGMRTRECAVCRRRFRTSEVVDGLSPG